MSLILIDVGGAEGGPPSTAPPGSTPPVTQRSGVPPTTPSQGFTYPSQTQMMFEDEDSFETGSSSGSSQLPPPSGIDPVAASAISAHADQISLTEFVGDDLYYFGDSLPANASAFLSYVLAGSNDDWDESGTRVHLQRIGGLFRYVGAVTIDDGISPLTMQMLFEDDPVVRWDDTQGYATASAAEQERMERATAHDIIDEITANAAEHGLDLGDLHGKTAQEVLLLYQAALAAWRQQRAEEVQRGMFGGTLPEDIDDLAEPLQNLIFSLDAPVEMTLDMLRWADDHIQGGHQAFGTAEALADSVRGYLLGRAAYLGVDLSDLDVQRAPLTDLTARLEQEYTRLLENHATTATAYYNTGRHDMTAAYLASPDPVPVNSPWYPVHTSQRDLDQYQRFGGTRIGSLTDALNNSYSRSADHNLLLLVGSILFEPLDWVVTGIEIIGDLARGDFGSAAVNTALAVLPIAGGWMDDLGGLRYAPDDPPSGGGLASGARNIPVPPNLSEVEPVLREIFGNYPPGRGSGYCDVCANEVGEALEQAGFDVDIVELGYRLPNYTDRRGIRMNASVNGEMIEIANSGFHEAVRITTPSGQIYYIDPVTYTNHGVNAVPWDEFVQQIQYGEDLYVTNVREPNGPIPPWRTQPGGE